MLQPTNSSVRPITPRRYFCYGLRTMFVVLTVFAVWLGWQATIVRERREAISSLPSGRSLAVTPDNFQLRPEDRTPRIPVWRSWLGDRAYALISAPPEYSEAEMLRLCRLFPEAVHVKRYNLETHRFEEFHRTDARAIAMRDLRLLIWPTGAFIALGAWLLVRVMRGSRGASDVSGN